MISKDEIIKGATTLANTDGLAEFKKELNNPENIDLIEVNHPPTEDNGNVLIPAGDDFSDVPIIGTDEKPPVSLRELARIDYTKELPPPTPALRVNGELFGTLGNFSLVFGKAKSRKTLDRKSTRLNSSHVAISYAVFCL